MTDELAIALQAGANHAGELEVLLGDKPEADLASEAQRRLLFAAMEANANDAMTKLGTTSQNQDHLKALTSNMDKDTAELAKSEANLAKFVSIGAAAAHLGADLITGDVIGAMGAVVSIVGTLGH